eukprot:GHVQ01017044.1.p1 GENE.GHVQ01017044.1~~GHVQ01017044.1.p1  ORF type:complete len:105 (+),score=19.52 GHVQ01017044.1:388-702(+)
MCLCVSVPMFADLCVSLCFFFVFLCVCFVCVCVCVCVCAFGCSYVCHDYVMMLWMLYSIHSCTYVCYRYTDAGTSRRIKSVSIHTGHFNLQIRPVCVWLCVCVW